MEKLQIHFNQLKHEFQNCYAHDTFKGVDISMPFIHQLNDHVKIILWPTTEDNLYTITVQLYYREDSTEAQEFWNTKRFEILQLLEDFMMLWYQDMQNNDPCAFHYEYDTDHLTDTVTLSCTVTDYLS